MYNRYIPQPDGSYTRTRHQDREPPNSVKVPSPQESPHCPEPVCEQPKPTPKPVPCPPVKPCRQMRPQPPRPEHSDPGGIGIGTFLRQLLPKDFDTGDLIVILLLLLMSSDCREDPNSAILTLALYLFL